MEVVNGKTFDEERALYGKSDIKVVDCKFDGKRDGESALKERKNVEVDNCYFNLRYPMWHVKKLIVKNSELTNNCRAAFWYDDDALIDNCKLYGIKALRECKNISIKDSDIISSEFFWKCDKINIENTKLESEYPFFECENVNIKNMTMKAKYSFQYVDKMVIKDSTLDTKDAFWHSKNVEVYDSEIKGEYLGWYSENLKLVRCKIIGTQPLCYCKNLILEDCEMINADLSFERSEVSATIKGKIDSIKNPISGKIKVDEIGELIIEKKYVDPEKTEIQCEKC
ncbi:MAG: DUF3737 family protein [Lachnospiraceae bacterium]|nr:DUF3737 family protein [Lachnospiraceae bacterium]